MPTYGYRCTVCDHSFEVIQSVSDEPIKDCPKCNKPVAKIFFPVGIAFKGSGFHINDYKSSRRVTNEKETSENGASKSTDNGVGDSGCASCASAGTCGSSNDA
ncbi:MAG TPA: FmdB family zinc ribbon protein [Candidatus Aquicultor sp.]